MTRAIIVDLDGTLYNSTHREHLVETQQWDEFHAASKHDRPHGDVLTILRQLDQGGIDIIACTGRNERHRLVTQQWFVQHEVPIDHLLMRPDDDFRSDTIVKHELVQHFFEAYQPSGYSTPQEWVITILEDRDKMVEHWRSMGFSCWQVRHGGY